MVTYEQIAAANDAIKTTTIEKTNKKTGEKQSKEYAEVNQRIKAFRMVYPNGFIVTEMLSNENGVCVFRATVGFYGEDNEAYTIGTGTAYEKENSTYINQTSYIENCETSAVGRALGMAGFGIDTSVASFEEVRNAINNQVTVKYATQDQLDKITEIVSDIPRMLQYFGIKTIDQLTEEQAKQIIEKKESSKNGN